MLALALSATLGSPPPLSSTLLAELEGDVFTELAQASSVQPVTIASSAPATATPAKATPARGVNPFEQEFGPVLKRADSALERDPRRRHRASRPLVEVDIASRSTVVGRRVVLDIGVNRGQDTARYLEHNYSVIGVEPNPGALEAALAIPVNRQGALDGRALFLNYAIGPPGASTLPALDFYVNVHNDAWSSFDAETACILNPLVDQRVDMQHCRKIKTKMTGCDELINRHVVAAAAVTEAGQQADEEEQEIALAKIDAEGQEHNCILGLAELPWRVRPQLLDVEVHKCLPQQTVALMYRLGYTGFKIVDQNDAGFSFGGSAPVGDAAVDAQTKGTAWRNASDILRNGRCPEHWCDLQARKSALAPSDRRWDAELDEVMAALETVWWHDISGSSSHARTSSAQRDELMGWRC